ncbi:MAG: TetR/AcrR family transcriptional regulator C-terminal domain-containing protein [Bacilli bacterium]|jgi:probable dihydroxyacetone kinase regulator|nr:TetR/AcrR family transcriptional regulator C-terminal domain-containing protein [Bacilli bacterium]MDD3389100.1 TetR/AcrR family transcriptional regulator C-terminal domain-containing protein [Bacilli bacterium]MDD4344739.1 TetR/AcrR family transcriptional regulator C-terminal domain-containing protein [Bacilli bacterium]MDD4520816.1 TetR/AcrR family transcriptional regulator C-terminal domain-containing protein [Bacilli bacterium]MDY0399672.1 TetR/AcrR family transcriptional regulator C-ter
MKTELKLGKALKTLMATQPLDTITVKKISEMCKVNRQTFYYHFRNIYDLLTWIYLNETVENIDHVTSWEEALTFVFRYVNDNAAFISNTLSSAGRELFIEFLYNTTYTMQLRELNRIDVDNVLSSTNKKFISQFYAPSFVFVVVHWADSGRKEDPKVLIKQVSILADTYLTDAIEKFRKAKAKK